MCPSRVSDTSLRRRRFEYSDERVEHLAEFRQRLYELVNEFKERGPDPDGDTYSFFSTLHPDENPPASR